MWTPSLHLLHVAHVCPLYGAVGDIFSSWGYGVRLFAFVQANMNCWQSNWQKQQRLAVSYGLHVLPHSTFSFQLKF